MYARILLFFLFVTSAASNQERNWVTKHRGSSHKFAVIKNIVFNIIFNHHPTLENVL